MIFFIDISLENGNKIENMGQIKTFTIEVIFITKEAEVFTKPLSQTI